MAILCNISDSHLYTTSSNFTQSNNPYSITTWINAVWSSGNTISLVGMYDGGVITPLPTTGLQIGSRGVGLATCWTYGGTVLVQSAGGAMTPYDNKWVLITYTYDGTTHSVYRNDTLLATATTAVVVGQFTQVYINGYPPTGSNNECSTHQVDAYAYYKRTLSLAEISTMYNASGSRHGIVHGLLARYDFDEAAQGTSSVSIPDISGNGNTMINTGTGAAITYTYTDTIANSNLRPVQ